MQLLLRLLPVLFLLVGSRSMAQTDTLKLSLPEMIILAQSDAPDVLIAKTSLVRSYWQFQSILANYKPQVILSGQLPDFNRSIQPIILPNGTLSFVAQSQMQNSLFLGVQQNVGWTGGNIFAGTSLRRIDDFNAKTTEYLSSPFFIRLDQPLFQFNTLKASQELQPLIYEESKRGYSEDMEQVAFKASQLFFNVLNAQLNVEAATRDLADADTLYTISKGRFDVGKIAETDLLQIELNVRNADAALAAATLTLQLATEELRDFLGIQQAVQFELLPPTEIPDFTIDAEIALQYAQANRTNVITFQRRLLEAEQDLAQAKGSTGFQIGVSGSFGLSQKGNQINDAYRDLLDQEQFNINFSLPIVDWGKAKSEIERAKANQAVVEMSVQQERISFERDILIRVQQFDLLRNQVRLAERAYEVAQRRNYITRQRYLIGKIGITDLNLALSEQENARQGYIRALQNFWIAYYEIRRLTLYDFENNQPLLKAVDGY